MRRFVIATAPALLLALAATAQAQDVLVEGPGIKVGEATVLHPRVGLEAGVISNVFYEESSELSAPILRLLAGIDIAPAGEDRLGVIDETAPRTIDFRFGANLEYTEFLTSDDQAQKQRNLDVNVLGNVQFFPKGNVSFILADQFQRVGRPTNFESSRHLDRDVNHFKAEMILQPIGHTISGGPRYENTIDVFESDDADFADRIQHLFGAKVNWKFFPYTQAWFDASVGIYGPLGDSEIEGVEYKRPSKPLRLQAGVDSVLTESTTVNAYVGYANGFYDSGPSFNTVIGGVDFGWRYTPTGRIVLGYRYDVHDSVNANFYAEHHGQLSFNQQIRTFVLSGMAGTRVRTYRGVPMPVGPEKRDDVILEGSVRGSWILLDRFSLYVDYTLQSVDTDYRTQFDTGMGVETDDPSYLRQEFVLGLVAAF